MRTVAVLCTYNEAKSLPEVILKLKEAVPGINILVVDDDSPDRTADIAAATGAEVLLRRGLPRGRGLAGRAGYLRALEMGVDVILEMDADGSHDPADAPRLLEALSRADVSIGSRACPSGSDRRGIWRRGVSFAAKVFLRLTLGLPLTDPTSGYRAFRRESLEKINPAGFQSVGPEIVEEVYLRAHRLGLRLAEVPIVFHPRILGESKLTFGKLARVLGSCVRMRFG